MPPDNVELVIDLEDTSGSVEEEASDSGSSFEVYDRQLLLHLWSSPLIQQSSDTLPIKKLDAWFAELLSDPAHPVPHPNARQHNTRRVCLSCTETGIHR